MADEDKLLLRIEGVERESRRMKLAMLLSLLLSAAAIFLILRSQAQMKQSLEAREILLKDSSGHVVARLGPQPIGACLEIFGKTKNASAALCVGDDVGADLLLTTRHGDGRVLISAGGKMYETTDSTKVPSILIAQAGKGLVSLAVGTDQSLGTPHRDAEKPAMSVQDSSGKILWSAP
jgi:hypothetical protein